MAEHLRVMTSDGVSLHYIEAGTGRPLLMIPGWCCSAAMFRGQIDTLSRERRVIALDMRGHGDSDKPEAGYRIQRLAKDLLDAVVTLGLQKPDVLGHSMGASVIWSYLSMFGDERPLGKLILVDQAPTVVCQTGWDDETRASAGCRITELDDLAAREAAVRSATTLDSAKDLIRGMCTDGITDADLTWIAGETLKMPRQHAVDLLHDHALLDWRSQIQMIENPTLVIGAEGSIFPEQSQRWIAAQIPGAELEIFEAGDGGSHLMFLENPARFNDHVILFLKR